MATNDKDSMASLPGSKTDKRKQSLYFPESMLQEIKEEAARLDRSLSWVVQRAWKISTHGDQEAAERQRRRGRRGRGGRLSPAHRGRRRPRSRAASDGTRLFVRTKAGGHAPGDVHAILSDGILCDGFIWKYVWDELAGRRATRPLALPGARAQRAARRSRADRHRGARRRPDGVRRHVGDPPCVLFGHSMGCQVALEAYRQRPAGSARARVCCAAASATSRARSTGRPCSSSSCPGSSIWPSRPRSSCAPCGAACRRSSRSRSRSRRARSTPSACTPRTCCRTCRT